MEQAFHALTIEQWEVIWENCNHEPWFQEVVAARTLGTPVTPGTVGTLSAQSLALRDSIQSSIDQLQITIMDQMARDRIRSQENAPVRGGAAEDVIESILSTQWNYERTSSKPHEADFSVRMTLPESSKSYRVIIDVKNYRGAIPSAEYDKFLYDIDNTHARGGIYFAFSGKITGRTRAIDIDYKGSVPIIIVQNSAPETIHIALYLLQAHFILQERVAHAPDAIDFDEIEYYAHQAVDQTNALDIAKRHLADVATRNIAELSKIQMELESVSIGLRLHLSKIVQNMDYSLGTDVHEQIATDASRAAKYLINELPRLGPKVYSEVCDIIVAIANTQEEVSPELRVGKNRRTGMLRLNNVTLKLRASEQVVYVPFDIGRVDVIQGCLGGPGKIVLEHDRVGIPLRKEYVTLICSLISGS